MEEKSHIISPNCRLFWVGLMGWFLFNASLVVGQQPYNTGGYWVTYLGDNKINDRFGVHSEAQLRNIGIANGQATKFFRAGINLYTSKTSMITGGYGFFIRNLPVLMWQELLFVNTGLGNNF